MSVLLETSLGDLTIDLFVEDCPNATKNFLKLCKIKYYNNCLFHNIQKDYLVQTGDPTNSGKGGESVYGLLYGEQAKYFDDEIKSHLRHKEAGMLGMANQGQNKNGSQFYITTGSNLDSLDDKHTIFGQVVEGLDTLQKLNEIYCDSEGKPLQVARIRHVIILDDPFDDPKGLEVPDQSPIPPKDQWQDLLDEEEFEKIGKPDERPQEVIEKELKAKEAKSREHILEIIGDMPDADAKPPDNVLFVCKLHPVTTEEDLETIFSRFGPIKRCEVIKDRVTNESLSYAFIEYENHKDCEKAYFKMDNVLIDDRRIHVDFSQSVSKQWVSKDGRLMRGGNASKAAVGPRFSSKGGEKRSSSGLELKSQYSSNQGKYNLVFDEEERDPKRQRSDKKEKKEKKRDHGEERRHRRSRSRSPPRERSSHSKHGDSDRYRDSNRDYNSKRDQYKRL
eukprot:TRINITY_DN7677_c0_g1_i1.p1 TRINITY_DN7677_c0_g1~~TRINITY_DN7677_c0_g1_i1.p1  ORF type:complete len:448 (-),score=139.44 TRINITY_DN7677_c0_g1_i1:41-1384(-)